MVIIVTSLPLQSCLGRSHCHFTFGPRGFSKDARQIDSDSHPDDEGGPMWVEAGRPPWRMIHIVALPTKASQSSRPNWEKWGVFPLGGGRETSLPTRESIGSALPCLAADQAVDDRQGAVSTRRPRPRLLSVTLSHSHHTVTTNGPPLWLLHSHDTNTTA